MNTPSKASCDPKALLRLVREGDASAMDRLTRCYGNRLIEVGRRQCRLASQAEDAVQDALASATDKLDQFRGEGSLEGWLSRMVTNACRHMNRGRKADPSLHESFDDESAAPGEDPDDALAKRHLGEQLATALGTLSTQDRAIVLLAEVNGWKGPEIAAALELTPGQVRTRLSRSRAKLREHLADVGPEWLD